MTRDAIATDKLAAPVGPFSLGVRGAGLLFLSGQVAQDPASGRLIDGCPGEICQRSERDPAEHLLDPRGGGIEATVVLIGDTR